MFKTIKYMPVDPGVLVLFLFRYHLRNSQRRAPTPTQPDTLLKGIVQEQGFSRLSTVIRTVSRTRCTRSEVDSKVQ